MTELVWGINTHGSFASVSAADQLDLAQEMGLTSIRIDVYDASPTTMAWLSNLVTEAEYRGISIMPVIVPSAASATSEAAAYAWGYQTASALAAAFPSLTWEVGNEMELYALKAGTTGQSTTDYDDAIYAIVRGSISGMADGIHQTDPTASVAVGISGFHFGFLQRLANDNVDWDITSEHYYSPAGSPDIASGADYLFGALAQFGKPIMMTEFNQQQGSLLSPGEQVATVMAMMNAMDALASKYNIIGAYLYELLDEPHLDPSEAYYGMASSSGVLNQLGLAVQAYLAQPPVVSVELASDTGTSRADRITSDDALTGTADPFALLHFTIDGQEIASTVTTDSTGSWTFEPTGLADGQHTIMVTETNGSGVTGSASVTFTLDTVAPTPSWTSMTTSNGILTLVGSTSGNANETVKYYAGTTLVGTGLTGEDGHFSITTGYNAAQVHVASAVATDLAGNTGKTSGNAYLGSTGRDTITGTAAADLILGGGAADTLRGGAGSDKFIYGALSDSTFQSSDTIADFVHGVDVIDFTTIAGISATNGIPLFQGNIAASGQIRLNPHSVGYLESGGNTWVLVNTSDTVKTQSADMKIILVGVGLGLTESDFHYG